ncbi:MAG: response regulator transcription factor [Cyclobacteriaceae bacterium]|jgi:two-component system nitrate/nitrite response regulator NarL|nr:response regulator transcription factor [Cytophagales bacterium]MCZ8328705.1 response regulator transcription factor [Cyclobacteriaceae bacterium]
MRTILVDDHAIIIDGVKAILVQHPLVKVIHTAQSADEALHWFKTNEADLLITDYSMPGLDAVSFIKTVKRILPQIKIIMLSMHEEIHLTKEILKSGVNAYILKKDTQKELLQAIEEVNAGRIYLSQDISKQMIQNMNNPDEGKLLTEREKEILRLITQEYNNKQIAESLFISERTVETHRKNIFRKTGTNSLVGLIKFAFANNLAG